MVRFGKRAPLAALIVAALSAALLTAAPVTRAIAATPMSGTLPTDGSPLTYTGGPFSTSNQTGQVYTTPACGATVVTSVAEPCDTFRLTVTTLPAGYGATHVVSVSIAWPDAADELDVYVSNADGVVASSATSSDPQVAYFPAAAGTYTVTVVPSVVAVPNEPFTGAIRLAAAPPTAPAAPPAPAANVVAPAYGNYAAPNGLSVSAGEPSIGADWATGNIMYLAATQTLRITFDDTVVPAAAAWKDVSYVVTAAQTSDPILYTDHRTNRTFVDELLGTTSNAAFTDNDGDNGAYTPNEGGALDSGVDHQSVGGGPFATGSAITATPFITSTYPDAVYYCSQDIGEAGCALSRDGGLSYAHSQPIYTIAQCAGIHGHVKVAPDGTVYVPNKNCNGSQGVAVSTDNGTTWAVRIVPGSTTGVWDPSVGVGDNDIGRPTGASGITSTSNTIYVGYRNGDGHADVAVSHDRGLTWSKSVDVGAAFGLRRIAFPTVVAGDDDRAAFAFLGTTSDQGDDGTPGFVGVWRLYIATTYDGGQTWTTVDATPNDPVQRGAICSGGTSCAVNGGPNTRNLLDFIDSTVDKQGRVLIGYADGCIGACVQGGDNSYTALASIARQSSGKGLFARYDQAQGGGGPTPTATPEPGSGALYATGLAGLLVILEVWRRSR